jgi:isopenicillin-N epimerase
MGLQAEFSWAGTKDYAPWLSTFAALEFYKRAGGESIRTHNHELAVWAGA